MADTDIPGMGGLEPAPADGELEITPPMLDAAEAELLDHLEGELGPRWPFARPVAAAVVRAALAAKS
jgi:hypothetical protein